MEQLRALGDPKVRERNAKNGAGENQFGAPLGSLRTVAKSLKTNHELALALWQTGNLEARLVAVLLMRPQQLTAAALETMVGELTYTPLADWLISYVVKLHPEKEALRPIWMESSSDMVRRAGWSLTAERIIKRPDGIDLGALLDRIEREMLGQPTVVQWTMNYCLAETGIHFPEHRERAIAIGERLGVFRDYPTSKGCTSPFAPLWIAAMVGRQSA